MGETAQNKACSYREEGEKESLRQQEQDGHEQGLSKERKLRSTQDLERPAPVAPLGRLFLSEVN
jgi:flagellar biosynthesis/type III secretory pathway protein FliH